MDALTSPASSVVIHRYRSAVNVLFGTVFDYHSPCCLLGWLRNNLHEGIRHRRLKYNSELRISGLVEPAYDDFGDRSRADSEFHGLVL